MEGYHGADRRRFPRFKTYLDVSVRKMDSFATYSNAVANDIGIGGIRISIPYAQESMAINQVVELVVDAVGESVDPIYAIGRIAWIEPHKRGRGFDLGIALTYIKERDKELFRQCLSAHEKAYVKTKS